MESSVFAIDLMLSKTIAVWVYSVFILAYAKHDRIIKFNQKQNQCKHANHGKPFTERVGDALAEDVNDVDGDVTVDEYVGRLIVNDVVVVVAAELVLATGRI